MLQSQYFSKLPIVLYSRIGYDHYIVYTNNVSEIQSKILSRFFFYSICILLHTLIKESLPELNSRLLNVLYSQCSYIMQFDSVACSIFVLLFFIDDVDTNSDDVWKTVQFIVNNHGANIIITLVTFYTVVISIFRKVLQYAKGMPYFYHIELSNYN